MVIVFFEALRQGVVIASFFKLFLELVFELVNVPNVFVSFFEALGFAVADCGDEPLCNDS